MHLTGKRIAWYIENSTALGFVFHFDSLLINLLNV
jgi:hypothetical protein